MPSILNIHYSTTNFFISQARTINTILKKDNWLNSPNETINKLNNFFEYKNLGLVDSINFIINFHFKTECFVMKEKLNLILNYELYK